MLFVRSVVSNFSLRGVTSHLRSIRDKHDKHDLVVK